MRATHFYTGTGRTLCGRRDLGEPYTSTATHWVMVNCSYCLGRNRSHFSLLRLALKMLDKSRPADPRDCAGYGKVTEKIRAYLSKPTPPGA